MSAKKEMSDDPRKGLPSASGVERVIECPGSFALSKLVPDWEPESDYAATGTLIHKALECVFLGADEMPELDEFGRDQLVDIIDQARDACGKVFGTPSKELENDPSEWPYQIFVEQRAWIRDKDLTQVASGQLDLLFLADDKALILDAKTGWGDTTPSEDNWQLITNLIALREQRDGIAEYYAGILQPNKASLPDLATYPLAFLDTKRRVLMEGLKQASSAEPYRLPLNPDADRWCKYCKARSVCPALRHSLAVVQDEISISGWMVEKADLPVWLDRGKEAMVLVKGLEEYAKSILEEDPDAVPGWELKPGNMLRKIDDAKEAFAILREELGITADEFLACVTIGTGKLEKLHKERSGIKGMAAKEAFNAVLDPVIKYQRNRPSLAKKK